MKRVLALPAISGALLAVLTATPASAGPAPVVEPGGGNGGSSTGTGGGSEWPTDVMQIGSVVLVLLVLLAVIALMTSRHAGRRVSTTA